MPGKITNVYHDQIKKDGFVIIRNFLTPQEVEKYKVAAEKVVDYARKGNWPYVRTRGKQFPPWPENFSPDIWGVTGLLHPDLGELSIPFHECYSSEKMLDIVCDILQTDKQFISMELLNMLINPLTDFELSWHRDHIKPEVSDEEEAEQLLKHPYSGTQFNLALTKDSCLIAIPGSHNRVRTKEEREKTTDGDLTKHISGEVTIELNPGDVIFYESNILHRAKYFAKDLRLTLHGSYGHVDYGKFRAKGVLQHGVAEWLPRFTTTDKNLQSMASKLRETASHFEGVDLGYSLDN